MPSEGAPNAKAQAPPNAKAQGPKPMPVSMRKHTGAHTCDVWSKGTGDGGLEETLANKTIEPPEPAPLRHCQWQKKVQLQQSSLSRMHPSNPIAGIGADLAGVRAGIRSHKTRA